MKAFKNMLLAGLLAVSCGLLAGQAHGDELDEIHRFLDEHVVNTKLTVRAEGTLRDGAVGYEFQRERIVCNLSRQGDKLSFDQIYMIKQQTWDLVDGEKSGEARIQDRILINRYEFGKRKSSGHIVGFSHQLTSTMTVWFGTSDALRLRMDDGALVMERRTVGHSDFFDEGDRFYPGFRETVMRWKVSDGMLESEETQSVSWRIDPETGELSERAEVPLSESEREVSRLPRQ